MGRHSRWFARRFLFGIFVSCGVLLAGCDREELTTPDTQGTVLAEETIGNEGGVVAAEEIILSIPAGALATDQTLSIYESDAEHPFTQSSESVFLLEGIPEDLGAAITLKVFAGDPGKNGSAANAHADNPGKDGSTTLFLGEERESQSRGRELTWYEVACQDSAGWCIASLDRGPYVMDSKAVPTIQVTPVKGLNRVLSSANHFEIVYHPDQIPLSEAVSMAAKFEEAYDTVFALGFHFGNDMGIWPRPVNIMNLFVESNLLGRYTTAPYGKGIFAMEHLIFLDPDFPRVVAYHEVFHMAQDFYDTRPPEEWKTLNMFRLWLDEACSSWIEHKAFTDPEFSPCGLVPANYAVPLTLGMWGARGMSPAIYGYGMSTLIRYITTSQGEDRILKIYEAFADSGNTMSSIQVALDPPPEDWFADYQRQLVLGDIYQFDDGEFFNNQPINATLNGDPGFMEATGYIRPFAASVKVIDINNNETNSANGLKFTVNKPLELSIFGLKIGQNPTLLGYGASPLSIGDLPAHLQTYSKFLFMSSRPYRTPGDYSTDVLQCDWVLELVGGLDLSRFETSIVKCKYYATWDDGVVPQQTLNFSTQTGSFTGSTFYAPWDYIDGTTHKVGHITITIDPESYNILSWSASNRWNLSANSYNQYEMSGTGMILEDLVDNQIKYEVNDAATCGVVTHIYVKKVQDGITTDELLGYSCDDNSYISIKIRDDE